MSFSIKRLFKPVALCFVSAALAACSHVGPMNTTGTPSATSQQQTLQQLALSSPVQFEKNKDGIWGVMDVKDMRMGSGFEIGPQGERIANHNVFISNPGRDGSNPYFYQNVDGEEKFLLLNGDQVQALDTMNPQTAEQARLLDEVRALADHFSNNLYELTGAKEWDLRPAIKSNAYGKPLTPKF